MSIHFISKKENVAPGVNIITQLNQKQNYFYAYQLLLHKLISFVIPFQFGSSCVSSPVCPKV